MSTISMCPIVGETDLQLIADLVKTCELDGLLDEDKSVNDLQWIVKNSPVKSRRLWKDSTGNLRGFGQLWIPEPEKRVDGYLWFYVDPRNSLQQHLSTGAIGLETAIISWAQERLRQIGENSGLSIHLHTKTRAEALIRIAGLERQGFTQEREFLTMANADLTSLPLPQLPPHFTLRSVDCQRDGKAWVQMYNESFIDHWDHHDLTLERWQKWQEDPNYQSEFDLVAIAPNGKLAAFCQSCIQDPEKGDRAKTGWIKWLGTRRGFRKMGLGRAMLLATMHRLSLAGATTVKLGVDADSPTGATRLYQSQGFQPVQSWLSYVKIV